MKTLYLFFDLFKHTSKDTKVDVSLLAYAPNFSCYENYELKHYKKLYFRRNFRSSITLDELRNIKHVHFGKKNHIITIERKLPNSCMSPDGKVDNVVDNHTLYR